MHVHGMKVLHNEWVFLVVQRALLEVYLRYAVSQCALCTISKVHHPNRDILLYPTRRATGSQTRLYRANRVCAAVCVQCAQIEMINSRSSLPTYFSFSHAYRAMRSVRFVFLWVTGISISDFDKCQILLMFHLLARSFTIERLISKRVFSIVERSIAQVFD